MTLISPFPMLNSNANISYRNIKLEEFKDQTQVTSQVFRWLYRFGVSDLIRMRNLGSLVVPLVLENKEVQDLLKNPEEHFDLILIDTNMAMALYGFGAVFKAPIIDVYSSSANRMVNLAVNNPENPAIVPNRNLGFTDQMTFPQRVKNFFMALLETVILRHVTLPKQQKLLKKYFPMLKETSLAEIIQNYSSMAFINTHPAVSFPRTYVPNMIEIAGIHLDKIHKKIPGDLQEFLDGATDGVIFFSMGSTLNSTAYFNQEAIIMRVLGRLKQRVVWKHDSSPNIELPKNFLVQQWVPQQAVLAHPNFKLFITHGGMCSCIESVYYGRPMLGIPALGDQHYNMAQATKKGYAAQLGMNTFTEAELERTIKRLLNDDIFTLKALEYSKILNDGPMSPQEKVLFWSEYVIRHKGAKHLRVQSDSLGIFAYHGVDVVLVTLAIALLVNAISIKLMLMLFCAKKEVKSANIFTKKFK